MRISELHVLIEGDDKPLNRALDRAEKQTATTADRMSASIARFSRNVALVGGALTATLTLPLLSLANRAINAASDLNESVSKSQQVFGQAAASVDEFARHAAKGFGMSRKAALDAASSYGLILEASGLAEREAATLSKSLTKLAGDLASFFNVSVEEAAQKLKSGLVGEAEPLRAFGVLLSETAVKAKAVEMGLAGAKDELTEGQKVQARYALILDQTAKAQGDFARTAGGLANMQRAANARYEDAIAKLGENLLPIKIKMVEKVNELLDSYNNLDPKIQATTASFLLLGIAIGPVTTSVGALAAVIRPLVGFVTSIGGRLVTLGAGIAGVGEASSIAGGSVMALGSAITGIGIPIAIVIGFVAALAAAWATNFGRIRDFAADTVAYLKGKWDELVGEFQGMVNEIVKAWKQIEPDIRSLLDYLNLVFAVYLKGWCDQFKLAVDFVVSLVKAGMRLVRLDYVGALQIIIRDNATAWMRIRADMIDALASTLDFIKEWAIAAVEAMFGWTRMFGSDIVQQMRAGINVITTHLHNEAKALRAAANYWDKYRESKSAAIKLPEVPKMPGLHGPIGKPPKGNPNAPLVPDLSQIRAVTHELQKAAEAGRTAAEAVDRFFRPPPSLDTLDRFRKMRSEIYLQIQVLRAANDLEARRLKLEHEGMLHLSDKQIQSLLDAEKTLKAMKTAIEGIAKGFQGLTRTGGWSAGLTEVITPDQFKAVLYMQNPWMIAAEMAATAAGDVVADRAKRFKDTLRDIALSIKLMGVHTDEAKFKVKLLADGFDQAQVAAIMAAEKMRAEIEKYQQVVSKIADGVTETIMKSLENLATQGFGSFFQNVINGFRAMLITLAREYLQSQLNSLILRNLHSLIPLAGGGGGGIPQSPVSPSIPHGTAGRGIEITGRPGVVGGREMALVRGGGHVGAAGAPIIVNMTVVTPGVEGFKKGKSQIADAAGREIQRALRRGG